MDHKCKYCSKSFPCGRSLGGHMRSHVSSSTEEKLPSDHSLSSGYGLRENPKKTWRLNEDEESSWDEDALVRVPKRKRRQRRPAAIAGSSPSVSESDEQEDVAITLVMLSRDVGDSDEFERSKSYESDSSYGAKSGKRQYECANCKKSFLSYQALGGHRASHKRHKGGCCGESSWDRDVSVDRKGSHQCAICGKVFASGQALGGHKRVHLAMSSTAIVTMPELLDLNLPADSTEFDCWWTGNPKSDRMISTIENR